MNTSLSPNQKEVISGLTAGTLTTLIVHPLDLLKVRFQVLATGEHRRYSDLIHDISNPKYAAKNRLIIKEAYRGLGINLLGNATAWGLYFSLYKYFKDIFIPKRTLLSSKQTKDDFKKATPMAYFAASASSGIITTIITNPIWVLKTRIMTSSSYNSNSWKGIKHLIADESVWVLWRGLLPASLGVFQGAIYFMIYDTLKTLIHSSKISHLNSSGKNSKLGASDIIAITSMSKMISVSSTYPLQLIKSNLQNKQYKGKFLKIRNLVKKIYMRNGIFGFYRGISANLLRAVPSTCITFCTYEFFRDYLK